MRIMGIVLNEENGVAQHDSIGGGAVSPIGLKGVCVGLGIHVSLLIAPLISASNTCI